MNDPVVEVNGVSKKFNNVFGQPRRDGIRDVFGKNRKYFEKASDRFEKGVFWALRDISFKVYRGETLGIIGPNGAGKSTLLKILSQIYTPTEGSFRINGRVSSLLEVGAGFHPELTGKENVYFNGSLLGMKKAEIDEKFQEIVDFAELGDFIDTPIKFYSSGMKSKLGFSVAVNLDAEVMIIDEALAVGDARFREKALKRMKESAFTGKTVIFVTHSMNFVEESCDRVLYIKEGRQESLGEPKEVVEQYLDKLTGEKAAYKIESERSKDSSDPRVSVNSLHLLVNSEKTNSLAVSYKDKVEVSLTYNTDSNSKDYYLGYSLFDEKNRRLWRADKAFGKKGVNKIKFNIDLSILKPGAYTVSADAYIADGSWVIRPKNTDAKIGFTIADNRKDIINPNLEGVVKPPIE